jgi:hypothetical protein
MAAGSTNNINVTPSVEVGTYPPFTAAQMQQLAAHLGRISNISNGQGQWNIEGQDCTFTRSPVRYVHGVDRYLQHLREKLAQAGVVDADGLQVVQQPKEDGAVGLVFRINAQDVVKYAAAVKRELPVFIAENADNYTADLKKLQAQINNYRNDLVAYRVRLTELMTTQRREANRLEQSELLNALDNGASPTLNEDQQGIIAKRLDASLGLSSENNQWKAEGQTFVLTHDLVGKEPHEVQAFIRDLRKRCETEEVVKGDALNVENITSLDGRVRLTLVVPAEAIIAFVQSRREELPLLPKELVMQREAIAQYEGMIQHDAAEIASLRHRVTYDQEMHDTAAADLRRAKALHGVDLAKDPLALVKSEEQQFYQELQGVKRWTDRAKRGNEESPLFGDRVRESEKTPATIIR